MLTTPHHPYFQPLDVVIFRPSPHFNKITQHLKLATLGWSHPINCWKTNFTKIFKEPWESITVALVKKGLRKCRISPLDRDAIDKSRLSDESAITNSQHNNQQQPPPTNNFLF